MMTIRCGTCKKELQAEGDFVEILEARLASGGIIACPHDGCTGSCTPMDVLGPMPA